MKLLALMDTLLRDREALYRLGRDGRAPVELLGRLLLVFTLAAGLYGFGMGSFRWIHPGFFFSDFELSDGRQVVAEGKVAGLNAGNRTIYTSGAVLPALSAASVRFNLTQPTEPFAVAATGTEKGFATIVLAEGAGLEEVEAWKIPAWVALKTPLLFLVTLLLCAPALYVLNLAFNMRLHFMPVMTLMVFALTATGVLLAVLSPIAVLFSSVTASYHFMKAFHLLVFAVAGLYGVKVLGEGLLSCAPPQAQDEGEGKKVRVISWFSRKALLCSWLILYAFVGGQMAWTLKPFLGTPYLPETPPFRLEEGNIYVSFCQSLAQMLK